MSPNCTISVGTRRFYCKIARQCLAIFMGFIFFSGLRNNPVIILMCEANVSIIRKMFNGIHLKKTFVN